MIITVSLNAAIDKRYEIDHFKTGQVNRVSKCTYAAGGKGINVARVVKIAGEKVIATGFVGGHTGNLIEQSAREFGLETDFIHVKGESRTCTNILDTSLKTQTEILEGGENISIHDQESMLEKYKKLLNIASIITISGSVPKGINSKIYKEMISLSKAANIPVLLDTSGQLLKDCIEVAPTLIKPNLEEMEQLFGKIIINEEELIDKGLELNKKGITYVVISLGAEGSILISPSGIYKADVPNIEAVNTVGCGDSMIAGFAVGLIKNWKDERILRFASAVSAANALRIETGYYLQEDFTNLYQKIIIHKINY